MAKVYTTQNSAKFSWTVSETASGSELVTTAQSQKTISLPFLTGTGANQINGTYHARRAVDAASDDDIDVRGGLTDAHGDTISLTGIKLLLIHNLGLGANADATPVATAANPLYVGGAGAMGNAIKTILSGNDQDGSNIVHSGGILLICHGLDVFAITAGTADILRVSNPGASKIIYDILILGTQ